MLRRTPLIIAAVLLGSATLAAADVSLTEGQLAGAASREPSADAWQSLSDDAALQWTVDVWAGRSDSAWAGALDEVGYAEAVSYTTVSGGTEIGDPGTALAGYGYLSWRTSPVVQWRTHWAYEPPTLEPNGRQYVFATESYARIQVSRKLFIPGDDSFARWLTVVRNGRTTPQYVELRMFGWLGYGTGAAVVTSSDGDALAETTDQWVTTRDALGSSELKTGHVFQGSGATVAPSAVSILDGAGSATWTYALTLDPGQTAIVMTFAVARPTEEEAALRAAEVVSLCGSTLEYMTDTEKDQVLNFDTGAAADSCSDPQVARTVKGDFNGDGQADILWRQRDPPASSTPGSWTERRARAAATFNPGGLADPAWRLAGIADFDRDGHQDLLWHHQTTGELYVWFIGPTPPTARSRRSGDDDRGQRWLPQPRGASPTSTGRSARPRTSTATASPTCSGTTGRAGKLYVWFLGYATAADAAPPSSRRAGDHRHGGAVFLSPSAMPDTDWQIRGCADFNDDGAHRPALAPPDHRRVSTSGISAPGPATSRLTASPHRHRRSSAASSSRPRPCPTPGGRSSR